MDTSDIRKRNLKALVRPEVRGNVAKFAREHNLDETWLRQIFNTDKPVREAAARKFEQQIGLPVGGLDDPSGPVEAGTSSQSEVIAHIMSADFLTAEQKTHLVGLVKTLAPKSPEKK